MSDATQPLWDIIVIGGGTAGMACAIAATEQGAHVLVIEKSARVGGTLHVTGGHMSGGGTQRQAARGIADSPDKHFDDVIRLSHGLADESLVRLAVNEAPHTIDWLDALGMPWEEASPRIIYGHEPYEIARTYYGTDAGRSILNTMLPRWDEALASGRLTLWSQHSLDGLLFEGGEVCGVTVKNLNDETLQAKSRAVVLATGGYAANAKLFNELTPSALPLTTTAAETSTGEVIELARAAGAGFRFAERYLASLGGIELEPGSGRADYWAAWAMVFTPLYRAPREIYVNVHGQRFMAEDLPSPHEREAQVIAQTQQMFWCVWDERAMRQGDSLVKQWTTSVLREHCRAGKFAWQADDLTTLTEKAGLPAANLLKTVTRFNQGVAAGQDEFGRSDLRYSINEPPYYALLTKATSLISFGGLTVNSELRVLNTAGELIPNLYAAGEIIGAGALMGQAFCGGMMLTPALSFGRWLGRTLANHFHEAKQ